MMQSPAPDTKSLEYRVAIQVWQAFMMPDNDERRNKLSQLFQIIEKRQNKIDDNAINAFSQALDFIRTQSLQSTGWDGLEALDQLREVRCSFHMFAINPLKQNMKKEMRLIVNAQLAVRATDILLDLDAIKDKGDVIDSIKEELFKIIDNLHELISKDQYSGVVSAHLTLKNLVLSFELNRFEAYVLYNRTANPSDYLDHLKSLIQIFSIDLESGIGIRFKEILRCYDKEEQYAALKEENEHLLEISAQQISEIDSMQAMIDEKDKLIEGLQTSLQRSQEARKEAQALSQKRLEAIRSAQRAVASRNEDIGLFKLQIADLKKEIERLMTVEKQAQSLKVKIASRNEDIEALKRQVAELKEEIVSFHRAEEQRQSFKESIVQKELEIKALSDQVSELSIKLQSQDEVIKDREHELKQSEDARGQLKRDLEASNSALKLSQQISEALKLTLSQNGAIIDHLSCTLQAREEQLRGLLIRPHPLTIHYPRQTVAQGDGRSEGDLGHDKDEKPTRKL